MRVTVQRPRGRGNHIYRQGQASVWRQEGQGTLEMAMVGTVLMVIILALIDFAFIFQAYLGVVSAANQGAMYASSSHATASSSSGISAVALAESDTWHCANSWVESSISNDAYGFEQVEVNVHCQVSDLIAIPGSLSDNIELTSTSIRRVKE